MEALFDDLRFTIRSLLRKPLFATVAVLTLALGIGANTAMYSVIHAAVLSPLPYEEPDRVARIYSAFEGRRCCPLSAPNFLDLRARQTRFQDLVAYGGYQYTLTGDGEPVRAFGYRTSDGLFELLGAAPQIGRFITAEDDRFGAEPVVVLADTLWRDRFGADPGVLGEAITIDGVPHSVIGVAPPAFRITGLPMLFTPFAWDPQNLPSRDSNSYTALGRLVDGTTLDAAMQEIAAIYADLVAEYPQITNQGVDALPIDEWLVGASRRRPLLILWGAVAMVLLVACANVVNLMLARAEARQRELALRAALGAGRARLVRHFLSESVLVSLAGAILGVAGAWGGLRLLLATYANAVPRSTDVGINLSVLLFATLVAVTTGVVVGLVPALQASRGRIYDDLRKGGRGQAGGGSRLRQGLVVLEVGTALILVVGAGLLLKSFWRINQTDVGVPTDRVITARISLPESQYPENVEIRGFFRSFLEELERLPRVEEASMISAVPFSGTYTNFSRVMPAGEPDRVATFVESRTVDGAIFTTLGLSLLQGRTFGVEDTEETAPVVVVNRELVRQLFPDDDAVGSTIAPSPTSDGWQIIGVVEDLREHGPDAPPAPTVYFSHQQGTRRNMAITARVTEDPLALVPDLRRIARQLDPNLPVFDIRSLDQLIFDGLGSRRFSMSLLAIFAALALTLGAIGIYGVMAYTVEQRTREIGLRQALGATRGSVVSLVVVQGFRLAIVGMILGGVGAYLMRQTLAGLLYEVSAVDPAVYAAVALVLAAVAALACYVPARRAATVHPMIALRND